MSDPQKDIREAAIAFADALNRAERAGLEPRAEIDWDNGLTIMFQRTKVWKVRLDLRGVEVLA